MVEFIDHKQAIKGAVLGSLNNIIRRTSHLKGWIRYDDKLDEEKFYELVKENQDLKNKLQNSKVTLKNQTKDLKQGNDFIEIKIDFKIYNKATKINQKGNEYTRYEYDKDDFSKVEISFNEVANVLLPILIQYGEQGLLKSVVKEKLYDFIMSKAGFKLISNKSYREDKVYFNDKKSYKANFTILELDKIITQLKLLNLISFTQVIDESSYVEKIHVYVCITEIGIEEFQSLFAYKKDDGTE
ncbi:hypothetical protein [Listeria rocourtiae]|nr:hypothetical protein [Listeria rocourtiae]EUJ43216.1 hypothetical protein PROCOU_15684 [Listeria rocourtiae FSL F6-920]